jgi:hypothetical protein
MVPTDPEFWISRPEASQALGEVGLKIAPSTLATLATRGAGPPYKYYARRTLYKWGDLLAWAKGRLSDPPPPGHKPGTWRREDRPPQPRQPRRENARPQSSRKQAEVAR